MRKDFGMQYMIDMAERFLPLEKWNFERSAQFGGESYFWVAIYDSQKCRIKIVHEAVPDRGYEPQFGISYGRLEVPDNAIPVLWGVREKDYRLLWHYAHLPLQFLDGLSPREAHKEKDPRLIREFVQSANMYVPENMLIMHAKIWETYGQRLFDIFDARNTDLWEKYCAFVKEYWDTFLQF